MEGADWCRFVCVNCQVVWRDCCVATKTNPFRLPLVGGAVESRGPFHMSCWEFPPGCVPLRVVVIDEGQAGATKENRLVGSWGWLIVKVPGVVVPPMELGLFARVVPICVGPLVSIVVCMLDTPAGFGGPHVPWRSEDESGDCKLRNRMEHWVRWLPGGCLANRLHMLWALLPLWLLLGVL